jgi:hypothetical protein
MGEQESGRDVRVVIVGSGFFGLGMAIRLKQAGIHDFVVLERAGDVGGTWRDNTYPGAACDVPSHLYSFSFAPNPGWSRSFSPQPEIWEYLQRCAREHGVLPHLRFGHELQDAHWDETGRRWRVQTSRGPLVQEDYNAQVQTQLQGTVWTSGGCASWYQDAGGRNTIIWPRFTWTFRRLTRRFDVAAYRFQEDGSTEAQPSPTMAA